MRINYVFDKSFLYSQFQSWLPAVTPKKKQPLADVDLSSSMFFYICSLGG
jgi:hypothetical protein